MPDAKPEPDPSAEPARARREPADPRPLPAPDPASPAEITIGDPGRDAARSLRIAPQVGAEARLEVTLRGKMQFSGDGRPIAETPLPAVTAVWKASVTSCAADGACTIDLTVEDASYDESHPDARTAKATARAMDALARVRASFILDPSGTPGAMKTRMDPRSRGDLRPTLEAMLMIVPILFVPAPESPLGAGAKWTASSTLAFAEMSLKQEAQYGVKRQDADTSELDVALKHTMPSPIAVVPGSRQITDLNAEIEGTIALKAGRLLPAGITAKMHTVQKSQASADSGPMEVELVLDMAIESKPADR